MKRLQKQAEINIGTAGHVDHGKTTIVKALTGAWTDTHSEEVKRGITIRLGYADADFRECPKDGTYTPDAKCPVCGAETKDVRRVSFVDCPGHETLMAVMLSGAALMDGALLVIAANEDCPRPQTYEHLMALNIVGIKNIVIVQNKVDLVDKEAALKNYRQIKEFVKGTVAENAPIIPAAAHYGINIPEIIKAIQENIPTPKRDTESPGRMFVARSFDVNKPGTPVGDLVGGVLGGSVIRGQLKAGDEVEIRPGIETKKGWKALKTKVTSLSAKDGPLDSAVAGGLVGIGTELDPSLTKNDKLVGSLVGAPGTLPECKGTLMLNVTLIDRMVDALKIEPVKPSEILVINIGTAATVGTVAEIKGKKITLALKKPVCCEAGWKAAISRRIANRWRLIGYGTVA